MINLLEERKRLGQSPAEIALQNRLVKLLKNENNPSGPHHSAYAYLLENHYFNVRIIFLEDDPNCTAFMDNEHMEIGIGEGLINRNPIIFNQLSVIVRHEIAHFLMKHELRLINLLGEDVVSKHIKYSNSLYSLLANIPADDEIANTRYLDSTDKQTVRNIRINGKLISGLVTEDHRPDWVKLSYEQMYKKIVEELEQDHARLHALLNDPSNAALQADFENAGWAKTSTGSIAYRRDPITGKQEKVPDVITSAIRQGYSYKNFILNHSSDIWDADAWKKTSEEYKQLPNAVREMADNIIKNFKTASDTVIKDELKKLLESKINEYVTLSDSTVVYSPEEKVLAARLLKSFIGDITPPKMKPKQKVTINKVSHSEDYISAHNNTVQALDDVSVNIEDINNIINDLANKLQGYKNADSTNNRASVSN